MDKITKSGKTVDDALHEALKELNASKDEVEVTVIDEGIKGFLGMFGAKDAVIQVVRKFNPEKIAVTFLQEMFQAMRIEVSIETQLKDKSLFFSRISSSLRVQYSDKSLFVK